MTVEDLEQLEQLLGHCRVAAEKSSIRAMDLAERNKARKIVDRTKQIKEASAAADRWKRWGDALARIIQDLENV